MLQPRIHICIDENISCASCIIKLPPKNICYCCYFYDVSNPHITRWYDGNNGFILWIRVIYALQDATTKETQTDFNITSNECGVSQLYICHFPVSTWS